MNIRPQLRIKLLCIPKIPSDNNLYERRAGGGGRRMRDGPKNVKQVLFVRFLEWLQRHRHLAEQCLAASLMHAELHLGCPRGVLYTKAGGLQAWDVGNHRKLAEDAFTMAARKLVPSYDDRLHRPLDLDASPSGDGQWHLALWLTPRNRDADWEDTAAARGSQL